MKKALTFIILAFSLFGYAQDNYFFADTVFEYSSMRVELKNTLAYRDKFKSTIIFTNLTDSFKIIEPYDIKLIVGNMIVNANGKNTFVIPPKSSRSFKIALGDANYKHDKIKTVFTKAETTGKIVRIYSPRPFVLDDIASRSIAVNQFPSCIVGNLQITLKSFKYMPTGEVLVKLNVAYVNQNFLGIHVKKIKIVTPEGKTVVNVNQESGSLYYRKQKSSINISLEFANPNGGSQQLRGDRLILEDVFCEYDTNTDSKPFEFNFTKASEGKGKITEEEKEKRKDIEVIED